MAYLNSLAQNMAVPRSPGVQPAQAKSPYDFSSLSRDQLQNQLALSVLSGAMGSARFNALNSTYSNYGANHLTPQQTLQKSQLDFAKQFRQDIPQMEDQMSGQLMRDTNRQLGGDIRNIRSSNSSRGLLYGGVNAGQEAGQKAQAARGLVSGVAGINQGIQTTANNLDSQAVKTGIDVQNQAQALQNQIYQNAMAQQAGQNQVLGSVASAAALALLL